MQEALEKWTQEKKIIGRWSEKTAHAALGWSKRFSSFLEKRCNVTTLLELKNEHLTIYRKDKINTLAKSSQANEINYLQDFFQWCMDNNLIFFSPIAHWRSIKIPRVPKDILTAQEIEKVLAAIDISTLGGIQNRAIVETFYATAMRRYELVSLNLNDLDIASGKVVILHGKGDKERIVPVTKSALFWLNLHVRDVRPKIIKNISESSLFIGRAGGRISTAHIARLMQRLGKITGIGARLAPHSLRHSCASHLMQEDVPLAYIQKFLGHASIGATQRYLHLANPEFKKNFDLAHPREKWDIQPKSSNKNR